jgi:D-3-phosphoglycerate dehydrogenase / 2-oxoglutarate reductase
MGARILVVGDSYMPAESFEGPLTEAGLGGQVEYRDVHRNGRPEPRALPGVREYQGDPAQLDRWLAGHTVLCVHAAPVTGDLLRSHPSVRLVACGRGGPVNVDLHAAAGLGVAVSATPGKNAASVADLTLCFVIMLLRRVLPAARHLRAEASAGRTEIDSTFSGADWMAREPRGRVLGLVGFGSIGRLVADQARALGMRVLAHDPYADVRALDPLTEPADLATLLRTSDIVSLHARATAANRGLLGPAELAAMKPGGYLINTARESLLDEEALLAALDSGHLAGAALDVYEPAGRWPRLALRDDVILTPHIGGATGETRLRGARMVAEDVRRFLAGQPLLHQPPTPPP